MIERPFKDDKTAAQLCQECYPLVFQRLSELVTVGGTREKIVATIRRAVDGKSPIQEALYIQTVDYMITVHERSKA
jgi:hypothetical protein